MTPELVLNELSLTPALDRDQARQRISELLQCIGQLGLLGVHGTVRISEPLDGVELAPGYPIGFWRGDNEIDLELRRLYNARVGVGPYLTKEEVKLLKGDEDIEVRINGNISRGCEATYLLNGVALSLKSGPEWDTPELTVQIRRLITDSSIAESNDVVRHISTQEHINHHREWIDGLLADVIDDDDLWNRKENLFPHLIFADLVRKELRDEARKKDRFRAIVKRLHELERYFAGWSGDQFDANGVGSRCTPETPKTLKDYKDALTRSCGDGVKRLFNYHVRFTPGSGRLYFFPDAASQRAHVGLIGDKLAF